MSHRKKTFKTLLNNDCLYPLMRNIYKEIFIFLFKERWEAY